MIVSSVVVKSICSGFLDPDSNPRIAQVSEPSEYWFLTYKM